MGELFAQRYGPEFLYRQGTVPKLWRCVAGKMIEATSLIVADKNSSWAEILLKISPNEGTYTENTDSNKKT